MTNAEIVSAVIANSDVIAAKTGRDGQGRPLPPSTAKLTGEAKVALQAVMSDMLLDQGIRRKILERTYTLTCGSATEYTLPSYITRVIRILCGSDSKPLRLFDDRSEYEDWYYAVYGDSSVDSSNEPLVAYISGRSPTGKLKITFVPGVGDETTLTIRYVRSVPTPYNIDVFPEEIHPAVMMGVLGWLAGGQYVRWYETAKNKVARYLDAIIGGPQRMKKGLRLRRVVERANSVISGPQWPSSGSVKWPD